MKQEILTGEIIKVFYKVYQTLGFGFREKVYENAMVHELTKMGLKTESQKKILVHYDGIIVGDFCCDMIVEDMVMCELKARESLIKEDEYQLINYLKATNIEIGLLLNFGNKAELKRKIYDNEKKTWLTTRSTLITNQGEQL